MMTMTIKKLTLPVVATAMTLAFAQHAIGATAEEAAKLKSELTPLGAERAGNADGSIPAWDGGYTQVPAGYESGTPRPDPFADEKPKFSITGANMDQYADKLTDGVKEMLKKYPDFRLDVYPTHRTVAAPQWVYDNTFKNATRAKLTADKQGVEGAYGGTPFPIVKDGYEAILNHRLAWQGETIEFPMITHVVTSDGNRVLATKALEYDQRPYYFQDGNPEDFDGYYKIARLLTSAPVSKAGEAILLHEPVDATKKARGIWQYLVGQRRVRKAPTISYDTPDFVTSGIGLFDEAFMLLGPIDRHELKLIGKKEMFVPYNNNKAANATIDELLGDKFLNPDLVRWELHRVWVVEATLKDGKRHVVPKRKYYIDEDSWQILLQDGWDAQGNIWRLNYALTLLAPDIPVLTGLVNWGTYNLQTGAYFYNAASNEQAKQYAPIKRLRKSFFSPGELANQGAR